VSATNHPTRRHALCWSAIALATVTGCATPRQQTSPTDTGTRELWSGRLALNVDSAPPQRWSAAFELSGHAQEGSLRLLSPFGQVVATAHWTPMQARLVRGDEVRLYPDMTSLTAELTGTALPVAVLFDWLQGLPTSLDGWEVDLSAQAAGRLRARRVHPLPATSLTLLLD